MIHTSGLMLAGEVGIRKCKMLKYKQQWRILGEKVY